MAFRVTLQPAGHSFEASGDRTLLESALDAGRLPPYGCRSGACGACKARVVSGEVDHGEASESALPPDERARGYALLCCARPRSDLVLECREADAARDIPVRNLPCRIQKMERLAPDVMVLRLKLPAGDRLQFVAGQYIEFLLEGGRRRAFSIANAPHDDEFLELHIRHVPGGLFTDRVFSTLKERDILRFEGPFGSFRLHEPPEEGGDRPIILLAGGTGFAPVKAIVEHVIHRGLSRPMIFYWGARDRNGLYLDALPRQWTAGHPRFQYVPVLSEPREPWDGRTGLVHEAVMKDFPDLSGHRVYACGAPLMIEAARRDFRARGLPASEFFADVFNFSGLGK